MLILLFKALRKFIEHFRGLFYWPYTALLLLLNGVILPRNLKVMGVMKVIVTRRGKLIIGNNLTVNSGNHYNIIGRQQKTTLWVEGVLSIGSFVGMSSTTIVCNHEIEIGDYVMIGGNTVIYDTDFHSLNPDSRMNPIKDKQNATWAKVVIKDNVFIGAHTTILKGVTIGKNSVIGACSVITKSIPENEIWAGNPACFIKKII